MCLSHRQGHSPARRACARTAGAAAPPVNAGPRPQGGGSEGVHLQALSAWHAAGAQEAPVSVAVVPGGALAGSHSQQVATRDSNPGPLSRAPRPHPLAPTKSDADRRARSQDRRDGTRTVGSHGALRPGGRTCPGSRRDRARTPLPARCLRGTTG